ncbi:sodium:proton antiporter [Rhodoferax sp.]|uniref:cation:proton antiporter n=1 Tax=Rhodoferax sp. TaxID=50421 RepID=UPI00260FEEAE|nr:sodium:proton antiporter [Rhodoferax sp.]MDD2918974.1 sodium:proton antiporter [Rhodoferax sp.]
MTNALWFLLVGGLLLTRGLTASLLKNLPVTPAIVYLAVGMLVGPTVFNFFHFNPLKESALLEVLTEVVVLISLFSAGVKMPVPVSLARWRAPMMLASVSMVASVGLIAAFACYALGLPLGAGILLGAILSPTDPVLATDVQTRHPGDRDQLRFTLTCEAGMNDGSAFPFVMLGMGLLGLHDLGDSGLRWVLVDVLWATSAGIAIGVAAGVALAHWGRTLRRLAPTQPLMNDFLGLGLIGVVYGLSVMVDAWGFLAVFFAAVALRQTEVRHLDAERQDPAPAPGDTSTSVTGQTPATATISAQSLIFKEHLERLSELMLVLLIGGSLFLDSWSWRAVALALFVFAVVRPVSVLTGLLGTRTSWTIRSLIGWFGVRGIGSLYYLMFAIQHGLPEALALELMQLTLIVVTLSIFVHGTSVKPLLGRFWRFRQYLPEWRQGGDDPPPH